ncbi:MAG: Tim44 domain-containing protein [Burkholderiales bacterium]|jgi:predicted lipid-binding transport protein (Tim44 family)|nr:MAG: Tim44 domain-containing protein [Burkholderiales bacterium]
MKWQTGLVAMVVALAGVGMVSAPMDAEAKRLGGGRASGMQRQMPARQPSATPNPTPQTPAAPNQSAQPGQPAYANQQAPAAQPGKRSWLGPIAGIAAGLGIAALMSHFGMGEAFGNMMTMLLLGVVAFMVIGWLMRRLKGGNPVGGPQLAGAGAPYDARTPSTSQAPMQRQSLQPEPVNSAVGGATGGVTGGMPAAVPAGFDAEGFTRVAKMIFIRLQAANDAANIEDLRKFTTPELFASLRLDIQERGQTPNQTDVMQLDAELVEAVQEAQQWVATVRFHGLIREEANAGAQPFQELWHLVKPLDGSRDWAIAGITPLDA